MGRKLLDVVGHKFTNNYNEIATVIEYINNSKVLIKFECGYENYYRLDALKNGEFISPYTKTCCNVGYSGEGLYTKGNYNKICGRWRNIFERVYSEKYHIKHPTYEECDVVSDWHNFQNFAKWCEENPFRNDDWQIDKDIRKIGNKIYGPDTCAFVPSEVNNFFVLRKNSRGEYPVGVYLTKNKYKTTCMTGDGIQKNLGRFDTPEEAFLAYKKCKESYAKELAEKYKGKVHDEVYYRLMNFTINIDD